MRTPWLPSNAPMRSGATAVVLPCGLGTWLWGGFAGRIRSCYNALGGNAMQTLDRITLDPRVMGGKPCIRGMRVTVGTIVGLVAAGRTTEEILRAYPYLEAEDVTQALAYVTTY